jgi:predicted transcriptional regulator
MVAGHGHFSEGNIFIPWYTQVYIDTMGATTIKLHDDTKQLLDQFREYRNESYDEVVRKLVLIARSVSTEPQLSREAVEAIEQARERVRKGRFVTEEEARKRLGL